MTGPSRFLASKVALPFGQRRTAHNRQQATARMPMGFWKVDTELAFHVNIDGLADAVEADEIIASRIRNLSSDPKNEVVAVVAHGPGDEAENQRWLEKITQRNQKSSRTIGDEGNPGFHLAGRLAGKKGAS